MRLLLIAFAFLNAFAGAAWGQTTTISNLPGGSAITGTERIPAAQGSCPGVGCTTVRISPAQIKTYLDPSYQPVDADLTSIAALTTTSTGRDLLTSADAAAIRTKAGAIIGTNVQAWDADLDALAALSGTSTIYYRSASNTWSAVSMGSHMSFSAGSLATTGLVIGTDIEAHDADLTAIAALSGTDTVYYRSGTSAWSPITIGSRLDFTAGTLNTTGVLVATSNLSDVASPSTSRTNLGLGSIATQAASSVSITGGSITGIADLAVADGGTGASNASGARTNLGLVIGTDVEARNAALAPVITAGRWYLGEGVGISVNAPTTPGANSMRMFPARIRRAGTIVELAVRVTTAAASGNVQAAVYASDAATLAPTGAAICSTGSMSTTATGVVSTASLTCVIPTADVYWFSTNSDASAATAVYASRGTAGLTASELVGSTSSSDVLSLNVNLVGYTKSQTFGTWPTLTGSFTTDSLSSYNGGGMPIVAFKY